MPKYKVNLARVTWLTAYVEADNEDDALEKAYNVVPPFTDQEAGRRQFDHWTASADDWLSLEDFYNAFNTYDAKQHGLMVETDEDA
ncbi:hypothetical protein AB0F17_08540 [Nonomuraea sp. NPDC026600]|uniref:hypothetical protein n=1 Tax=Nonomuraea sp. NPDC026600 TaxID=3155363 RepID=UPI0033CD9B41